MSFTNNPELPMHGREFSPDAPKDGVADQLKKLGDKTLEHLQNRDIMATFQTLSEGFQKILGSAGFSSISKMISAYKTLNPNQPHWLVMLMESFINKNEAKLGDITKTLKRQLTLPTDPLVLDQTMKKIDAAASRLFPDKLGDRFVLVAQTVSQNGSPVTLEDFAKIAEQQAAKVPAPAQAPAQAPATAPAQQPASQPQTQPQSFTNPQAKAA